jgi:hypothetical protein
MENAENPLVLVKKTIKNAPKDGCQMVDVD